MEQYNQEEYPIQDDIWPSRRWNKDRTEYIDLSGEPDKIKEIVKKAFSSELGQQIDGIYSTSDNRMFIRKQEAIAHSEGQLDQHSVPLSDKTVLLWWEEDGDYLSLHVWPDKQPNT